MGRVVVRILASNDGFLVLGRRTLQWCATFDEAWAVSVDYFTGRRW